MGTVLSQLSNRQEQIMPSTRSKAKSVDPNEASKSNATKETQGRKVAKKDDDTKNLPNATTSNADENGENEMISNIQLKDKCSDLEKSKPTNNQRKPRGRPSTKLNVETPLDNSKHELKTKKGDNPQCTIKEDEDSDSDKENEYMDDKENDEDWDPIQAISPPQKTIPMLSKPGRKPLAELISLVPQERDLSEYEKLQLRRKAEQRAMLDAMKKASLSLSKAVIPKKVVRQIVKVRKSNFAPSRKEPPVLRSKRARHNSRGSSDRSSETGDTDSFVYLPAKRKYEFYSDDEEEEYKPKKRSKAQRKRDIEPLTEEERNNLKAFDMEDFKEFLRTVPHGRKGVPISDANARTVIRQVKLMVSGAGVGYHHWPSDVFWRKGEPVRLNEDFDQLKEEAVQMENQYGRDLGNGWLLNHPLQKLQNFQNYLYSNQNE